MSSQQDRCSKCNGELSYCGEMTPDGPSLDCRVCQLESDVSMLRSELARVKEAAELLGHAHRAHLHLRSLEDGLCGKVLPVPPLDPKHPLREMLTNYGMAQLDCVAAEEALDANPTAAAFVEQARKEKA